ncbi:MAG: beta-N-acetylhexosaminidase [Candidatus Cloacimonadaceae bacterium]
MIPYPAEVHFRQDRILLPQEFKLSLPQSASEVDYAVARFLNFYEELKRGNTAPLCIAEVSLRFVQMQRIAASHKDMHLISIEPQEITISAKSDDGFRYALATLKQLIRAAFKNHSGKLYCGRIIDYPAYGYRGLHLDESRHFFGSNTVKDYLDYMADYKLNYLHWHLSDDQGWRVESKRFPLLSEISAWRTEADGSFYGGFYTQESIKDIIRYASRLGITIVPEFDFPGHSLALLAAYPHLACKEEIYQATHEWGIFEDILCAGKDSTLSFLRELLEEYSELFPGEYFHIGGDEAPKTRWAECPDCNIRLNRLGLKDFESLQGWFTNELNKILKACGKEVIAWDEVLDSPIDSSVIAMLWRGDAQDSALLAQQYGVRYILCPNKISYLDWRYSEDSAGAHGISTLENVYSICPQSYAAPELCLGLQANLWTEYIHNPQELFKMLHPRAVALAERAWNPGMSFHFFQERLVEMEG